MRFLFRNGVQRLEGFEDTEPNGRAVLPELLRAAGFEGVRETQAFRAPIGSISLYRGVALEARTDFGGIQ